MANPHTCTVTELKEVLTQAEISAIPRVVLGVVPNAAGGALTQAQEAKVDAWLEAKLTQATDKVVSAVNACAENPRIKLGARKVPSALAYTALVIARHAVISAIPGMSQTLEGSSRAAEYNTAMNTLAKVASCDLFVNDYADSEDPDVTGGGGGVVLVGNKEAWPWEL